MLLAQWIYVYKYIMQYKCMFVFSFSQDVYVMYERCLDPALSVRKQALSSLTALTLDQPHCTMLHTYVLRYVYACIIESVDSICRDSADTQYMLMQKIILKISKTANL